MKTRFVALAVAATLGLGSVSAFAQEHHRDGRDQAGWQHQRAEQGRRDWGDNHRYVAPRYYGPSYGYRRDDRGDVIGAVVLGAITGALLGQAANSYNFNQPPAAYYPPPAAYYNPGNGYNPGYGYYGN
jgi:hypothetical protein